MLKYLIQVQSLLTLVLCELGVFMRRVSLLAILLVSISSSYSYSSVEAPENQSLSTAGDVVELSFSYLPEKRYSVSTEINGSMVMSVDDGVVNPPKGFEFRIPVVAKSKQVVEQAVITGKKTVGGSYPIEMTMLRNDAYQSFNGSEMSKIPNTAEQLIGLTMLGEVTNDGGMKYISIKEENVPKEVDVVMESLFSQVGGAMAEFNGKSIRVGGSVTQLLPMRFPAADGSSIALEIEIIYKLISITKDLANFDLDYKFILNASIDRATMGFTGAGGGSMTYDTVMKYVPEMDGSMRMEMRIPLEGGDLLNVLNSRTITKTSLE